MDQCPDAVKSRHDLKIWPQRYYNESTASPHADPSVSFDGLFRQLASPRLGHYVNYASYE